MTKRFAVALFLFSLTAAAADRVQPGQWETTMTMGSAKPMVTKYCITAAEAKLMSGDLPTLRKYLQESTETNTRGVCKVKDVALSGNRTIVTLVCGKNEITNTTTYHGDRYESTSSNGTTVAGKKLGACPKP